MSITINSFSSGGINDINLSLQDTSKNVVFTVQITSQNSISSVSINNDVTYTHLDNNTNTYYFSKLFKHDDYNQGNYSEVFTVTVQDSQGNTAQDTLTINVNVYDYYVNSVSYYVSINANINNNLYSIPDPSNSNNSIIGLQGGIVQSASGNLYDPSYNLPTAQLTLKAGIMIATNYSKTDTEFFDIDLDISLSKTGDLTSTFKPYINSYHSNAKLVVFQESAPPYVKILNWPSNELSSIENKTQSELVQLVKDSSYIYYFEKNDVDSLEDNYTLNVIDSWKFQISEITAVKNNIIEQYAEHNNRTYPNIFNNGEHIVLETAHSYDISFLDSDGVTNSLITQKNIYAVVTHDSSKPTFSTT